MRDNGTDRDIALMILDSINSIKEKITIINANLFSPYIFTQPVDVENAAIGDTAVFSVSAVHVASYQWQSKAIGSPNWNNTALSGYNTDTLTVSVTEVRLGASYRCVLTGTDGTVVTSGIATIIPAET